ncbi:MAG: hypothetical protein ABW065_14460 [Solirubrobacterales bacterium]
MSAVYFAGILLAAGLCCMLLLAVQRRNEGRLVSELMDSRLEGFRREVLEFRGVEKQVRELGLSSAERSICDFDYSDAFRGARELTILMHDGASWLRENKDWINSESRAGMRIKAIFVHPESNFVPILAYRQRVPAALLAEKILASARLLQQEFGDRCEVWGHVLPTSYSVVMSESKGVFMPYPASRERGRVPAFVFTDDNSSDGFLMQLRRDVEALRVDCRPIFEDAYPSASRSEGETAVGEVVPADFEWRLRSS